MTKYLGWSEPSLAALIRSGVLHIVRPGVGRGGGAGNWIPGPERRALVALDQLRRHGGTVPRSCANDATFDALHRAQVAVARAARSHAPATLVDTATNAPVDDAEAWVCDWRSSGGTVALLVRVSEG